MARFTIRRSPTACDGGVDDEFCALPESGRSAQSSKTERHFQDLCENVELFTKSQVRFLTLTSTRSAKIEKTAIYDPTRRMSSRSRPMASLPLNGRSQVTLFPSQVVENRVELLAAVLRLYMVPEHCVVRNCAPSCLPPSIPPSPTQLRFLASASIPPSPSPVSPFFVHPPSALYSSWSSQLPYNLPPRPKSPAEHPQHRHCHLTPSRLMTTATAAVVTTSGATAVQSHNHPPRPNGSTGATTAVISPPLVER